MDVLFFVVAGLSAAVGLLGMVALVGGAIATAAIDGESPSSVS